MVRGEEDCAVKVELVQCFRCRLDGNCHYGVVG